MVKLSLGSQAPWAYDGAMTTLPNTSQLTADELRGTSRLAIEAVLGVTDIVEAMHSSIAGKAPILGTEQSRQARGISGLVYSSVRGITRLVGGGLELAHTLLPRIPLSQDAQRQREVLLAKLNGVVGDHLEQSANPLAIPLRLRVGGQALILTPQELASQLPNAGPRVLLLVHGLCMNDLQWNREGHDHGVALADALGYTPVYLHYNSGRRISHNGRDLAALLDQLLAAWPQPVSELVLLGHSMGGLVIRSALAQAQAAGQTWASRVTRSVFLGTPHHGAPLERAGNAFKWLLDSSPYSAPLGRLGGLRSAGIQDLRYGNIHEQDWADQDPRHAHDTRTNIPLPDHVRCLYIAASRSPKIDRSMHRLRSDGLVPVASALGEQPDENHGHAREILCQTGHLELLNSHHALEIMQRWLSQ